MTLPDHTRASRRIKTKLSELFCTDWVTIDLPRAVSENIIKLHLAASLTCVTFND